MSNVVRIAIRFMVVGFLAPFTPIFAAMAWAIYSDTNYRGELRECWALLADISRGRL